MVNSGQASWYDLASRAVSLAGLACEVSPITSEQYPQKAKRPEYSVLSTAKFRKACGVTPRAWPLALADYLRGEGYEIPAESS